MRTKKIIDFREQTLSKKTVFHGKIFDLVRHVVRLPNGKKSTRDLVLHPGAVGMIPVDADGNILMVRQFRKAVEQVMLEIPAGTLDSGESHKACVQRELQEEIGFKARSIRHLVSYYPAPGYTTEMIHIFVAKNLVPSTQPCDHDEFLRVVPMKPQKILDLIRKKKIRDSKTIIAMLFWGHDT